MSEQDHMRDRIADLESCVALQRQVISAYQDAAKALRQVAEKPIAIRKEHWAVELLRTVVAAAKRSNMDDGLGPHPGFWFPEYVVSEIRRELNRHDLGGCDG